MSSKQAYVLVTLQPRLGDLPVVVCQDVVAMDDHRVSVVVQTVDKIEAFWSDIREQHPSKEMSGAAAQG